MNTRRIPKLRNGVVFCLLAVLLMLSGFFCRTGLAAPVGSNEAKKLVREWLRSDIRPLGSRLGNQVDSIETFTDDNGQALYYVVYLRPNGFVIVPAEDNVEPVVCFVSGGCYDPSENNPLGALVSRDLPDRVYSTRAVQEKTRSPGLAGKLTDKEITVRNSAQKASGKWARLLAAEDSNTPVLEAELPGVSDVRVAPLVETEWGQDLSCYSPELACYNYFTPPYSSGDPDNYVCGCIATAMAQYMRFQQYPTFGVGTSCFTIYVYGSPQARCLRGGDGYGGPYNWSYMTLDPGCSATSTQRQAIGALTHDAGVAVAMNYQSGDDGGSGASPYDATMAMVDTFGYSNAVFAWEDNDNIGTVLNDMVNPNLDWGNPVILSILGGTYPYYGHAVVADGYGYQSSTLYHHINMGWDGYYDAWYNLPTISSSPSFHTVYGATYNIYKSGSGEIISGRVTNSSSGVPLEGAAVTAQRSGGGTYQATTNSNGIYAVAKVPSNSSYTVSVTRDGYSFSDQIVYTGISGDMVITTGNRWGIDFEGTTSNPTPPVASDSFVSADTGAAELFTLTATDDGLPNPPGILSYIITSLPGFGLLSDPLAGDIDTVPYVLTGNGSSVTYTSAACFVGSDSFEFKANDGGEPDEGGDSNIATVSITVEMGGGPEVFYETHFDSGLPAGWTIVDGGSSTDTWRSDNPAHRSSSQWDGVFMIVDSDYAVSETMDEQLITHSIDCTGLSDIKLRYKHYFNYYESGQNEIGDVDVRIDGGSWQNIARYQGADTSGQIELDLSAYGAEGAGDVQIRWHYYNAYYEWFWGIDDVEIIATSTPVTSPEGDLDRDCDVDYYDLSIFTNSWLAVTGGDNWNDDCDMAEPKDGLINELDYAMLAQNWLANTE